MPDLVAQLDANLPLLSAVVLLLLVLLLAWDLWLTVRLRRLRREAAAGQRPMPLRGGDTGLDMRQVYDLVGRVHRMDERTSILEAVGRRTVQRVGLVRYNPFEDTGSNQSFALALLDGDEDGVVISSLHSRANTRIYAKPINGGRAEAALSDEEAEALRMARSGGRAGVTA